LRAFFFLENNNERGSLCPLKLIISIGTTDKNVTTFLMRAFFTFFKIDEFFRSKCYVTEGY